MNDVFYHLRSAALVQHGGGPTDGQLLESYLTRQDQAAFEVLLRRHGPMVLGVCQRVLSNSADVEDAFQATFAVFVRKAASIVPRERVGNWLYGVAYRTALEARSANARRRAKERKMARSSAQSEDAIHETHALLDHELARLSDKYRVPVVLCELEGRSRKEVAHQLGIPEGTLSSRLAAARKLLAKRLAGNGLTAPGMALALLLPAIPSVPPTLFHSTLQAAAAAAAGPAVLWGNSPSVAALALGVLKTMFISKLYRSLAFAAFLALMFAGSTLLLARYGGSEGAPGPGKPVTPHAPAKDKVAAKSDKERLEGTWIVDAAVVDGDKTENNPGVDYGEVGKGAKWVFAGDKLTVKAAFRGDRKLTYRLDPDSDPKAIDLVDSQAGALLGIYRLEDDTLTVCAAAPGKDSKRPTKFTSERESRVSLLTLKRAGKGANAKEAGPLTEEGIKAAKAHSIGQSRQILLAIRVYEEENGHLPTAAIYDEAGKPLLSWRVAILKHLANRDLFKEFHLDEPWDSDHNKKLLAKMPSVYAPAHLEPKRPHATFWKVFVGKGTAFFGTTGLRLKDVTRDQAKTVVLAEGGEATPWTKPDDLPFAADKPLPRLGGSYPDGFIIGTLAGDSRFVKTKFDEKLLRLAVLRSGDDTFDLNDLDK
jgi:RNA polymerase sigma factor (sigma-70 family)